VELSYDYKENRDRYRVVLRNWPAQGDRKVLAEGWLDEGLPDIAEDASQEVKDPAVSGWV